MHIKCGKSVRFLPSMRSNCSVGPILALLVLLVFVCFATTAWADEFGRLEGASLFDIPGQVRHPGPRRRFAIAIWRLCRASCSDERAAFVIVKTDQGNLAKVLVIGRIQKADALRMTGTAAVPVLDPRAIRDHRLGRPPVVQGSRQGRHAVRRFSIRPG